MISAVNKAWVEEGYAWLEGLTAVLPPRDPWITFGIQHFPTAYNAGTLAIGPLVDDLCALLSIDPSLVSARFVSDAPVMPEMPFQMSGLPVGSGVSAEELDPGLRVHSLFVAERLKPYRELVLHECILRLMDILAHNAGHDLPDEGEGHRQWAELAAIRYGFAPILACRRNASLLEIEGGWRTTMTHRSPLPISVFAYSVLHHLRVTGLDDRDHRNDLPSEIRHDIEHVDKPESQGAAYTSTDIDAYCAAFQELWEANRLEDAISFSERVLSGSHERTERSIILNNIGYTHSFLGRQREAEGFLRMAMGSDPAWAYPMDNLGFALILQGRLDEGEALVRTAMKARKRNVRGYSERNLAVYHWLRGESERARAHFTEAFEEPMYVDLLTALYARFLRTQGEDEEAEFYEEITVQETGLASPDWVRMIG